MRLWERLQPADPEHIAHLEATAAEELQLGFVEGPFQDEEAVTAHLGSSGLVCGAPLCLGAGGRV